MTKANTLFLISITYVLFFWITFIFVYQNTQKRILGFGSSLLVWILALSLFFQNVKFFYFASIIGGVCFWIGCFAYWIIHALTDKKHLQIIPIFLGGIAPFFVFYFPAYIHKYRYDKLYRTLQTAMTIDKSDTYNSAIVKCTELKQTYPTHFDNCLFKNFITLLNFQSSIEGCETLVEKIMSEYLSLYEKNSSQNYEFMFHRAKCLSRSNFTQLSKNEIQKLCNKYPSGIDACNYRAMIYKELSSVKECGTYFKKYPRFKSYCIGYNSANRQKTTSQIPKTCLQGGTPGTAIWERPAGFKECIWGATAALKSTELCKELYYSDDTSECERAAKNGSAELSEFE